MKKQSGFSLSGLIFWGVVAALVSLVVIKMAPSAIEYYKIRKNVTAVAQQAKPDATVGDLRVAFVKRAEIDQISDVHPNDLDITKEGSQIVISFAYEKRISLFGPFSLVISYSGSSGR